MVAYFLIVMIWQVILILLLENQENNFSAVAADNDDHFSMHLKGFCDSLETALQISGRLFIETHFKSALMNFMSLSFMTVKPRDRLWLYVGVCDNSFHLGKTTTKDQLNTLC